MLTLTRAFCDIPGSYVYDLSEIFDQSIDIREYEHYIRCDNHGAHSKKIIELCLCPGSALCDALDALDKQVAKFIKTMQTPSHKGLVYMPLLGDRGDTLRLKMKTDGGEGSLRIRQLWVVGSRCGLSAELV